MNSYCSETDTQVTSQAYCMVPMSELIGTDYNLVRGSLVVARVQAYNLNGFGVLSTPNSVGATVETIPDALSTLTNGYLTTNLLLSVQWSALTSGSSQSGGATSVITSYNVQWDSGLPLSSSWVDLQGASTNSLATSFQTSSVTPGASYRVKVRAKNSYGWGPFSSILTITTALAPNAPPTVTTITSGTSVQISWTQPANNGISISKYDILIMKKDGTFTTSSQCLGTDSTIMSNL